MSHGLTEKQIALLVAIAADGCLRIGRRAMTAYDLERKGLVAQRVVGQWNLTEAGRAALAAAVEPT